MHLINLCSPALQWQPQIRWHQPYLAAGFAAQLTNITLADVARGLAAVVTKLCMQCQLCRVRGGGLEKITGAPEVRRGSRYVTYVFLFLANIFQY
jgi:hypothetical protein